MTKIGVEDAERFLKAVTLTTFFCSIDIGLR